MSARIWFRALTSLNSLISHPPPLHSHPTFSPAFNRFFVTGTKPLYKLKDHLPKKPKPEKKKRVVKVEPDEENTITEPAGPDINEKVARQEYTKREIAKADQIGYKVIGPAKTGETHWHQTDIFAVFQIGSQQFKVCSGDRVYVEKLKYVDVNEKILLNKILMLGTKTRTIIGRPLLYGTGVHAIVEECAVGHEVIVFKKKRRKGYRRCNTHSQTLTRLKILGVEGLEEVTKPKPRIKLLQQQ